MNNEEPTNEAEAKKLGTLTAGIDHMIKVLEQAADEARRAIGEASLMPRDGMKWMRLSKAVHDVHELTRQGWYNLIEPPPPPAAAVGTGAFFTSPEVMKVLKDAEKKASHFSRTSLGSIPEININFKESYTPNYYKAIAFWCNEHEKRVYELTVKKVEAAEPSDAAATWRAVAQADGRVIFSLRSKSKSCAIELGLAAFRRYLVRGHRCAWRTYRKGLKKEEAL